MADRRTPKPTGRRVRGYISDLVELSAPRALWTAVVYHQDYRDDPALAAAAAEARTYAEAPGTPGIPPLRLEAPGVFAYDTGEIRSTREVMGAARRGIGWRAATEWFVRASTALAGALEASGRRSHGSLDPHRVLVDYDGGVQLIGLGLPRLDLLDFLDDATLIPPREALRFTAPESLEGAGEDFSSDLFVLGLMAARLAQGVHLYDQEDARALLTATADGEAARAAQALGLPEPVQRWLLAPLQPWSDERPTSLAAAIEAAEAALASLDGPTLQAQMERLAEVASDVEVDLPRGWTLPVPPPPLDEAHRDRCTARLDRVLAEAAGAVQRTRARREALAERAWSSSDTAAAAWEESGRHLRAAQEAVDAATEARARAASATSHDALGDAQAQAEDAGDRARGANVEALRALDRATEALDAAEARTRTAEAEARGRLARELCAEVEALQAALAPLDQRAGAPLTERARAEASDLHLALQRYSDDPADADAMPPLQERAGALRAQVETLTREADAAADARQQAERAAAEAARAAAIASLDARIDALVALRPGWDTLLERGRAVAVDDGALRDAHRALVERLDTVQARRGARDPEGTRAVLAEHADAILAGEDTLTPLVVACEAQRAAADADRARREQVSETLVELRKRAVTLADGAQSRAASLVLLHADQPAVREALAQLEAAEQDARAAADALTELELDPDDDPDVVLDAAQTHLQFAQHAAQRAEQHADAARQADTHETERLDQERAATLQRLRALRDQLGETGERVRSACDQARNASRDAHQQADALLTPMRARSSRHLAPLERALQQLDALVDLLAGRRDNWQQMAEPAPQLDDTDALEALVATGEAEAEFAEADLRDLPALVDAMQAALAAARTEQDAIDDARAAALARLAAADRAAEAAEAALPPAPALDEALADDRALADLAARVRDLTRETRAQIRRVRDREPPAPHLVPDEDDVRAIEACATRATDYAEEAATVAAQLAAAVRDRLEELAAEQARREHASREAREALEALTAAAQARSLTPEVPADEAVAERVTDTFAALQEALGALPELPSHDIDADPVAAAASLLPLVAPARAAAAAAAAAHRLHLDAVERATQLVAALRQATADAEAAADRAASASAVAHEQVTDLLTPSSELAEDQRDLRERLARIDRAAAEASRQAEAASDATTGTAATAAAEHATRAADEATAELAALRPHADALREQLGAARRRQAAEDEQRRIALVERARALTTQARALSDALDEAGQEAIGALEDSASSAARERWELADELIEGAGGALQQLDLALEQVFQATDADRASAALERANAILDAAPSRVDEARAAAREAADVARRELADNEQLVVDLRGLRIEIDGLTDEVRAIRQDLESRAVALEQSGTAVDIAESLAAVDAHQAHLAEARAQVDELVDSALACRHADDRAASRSQADGALQRAIAVRNTVRAQAGRLEGRFVEAETEEQTRRDQAVQTILAGHARLMERIAALRTEAAAATSTADDGALVGAVRQVHAALQACEDAVIGSEVRAEEASVDTPARMLEHLVQQGDRAERRLDERAAELQLALASLVDAQRSLEAERQAAYQERVRARDARQRALDEALHTLRQRAAETREAIVAARDAATAPDASAAAKAWAAADAATDRAEEALQRAQRARDSFAEVPGPHADDDDIVSAGKLDGRAEASARRALTLGDEALAEAHGLLADATRAATALAGILADSTALETQHTAWADAITARRERLADILPDAPATAASRGRHVAVAQLDEGAVALAQVRSSLDALRDAGSPEQASALLEIAEGAIDIAGSVLDYAVPLVDGVLQSAHDEAAELRARRARVEAALEAHRDAIDVEAPAAEGALRDALDRRDHTADPGVAQARDAGQRALGALQEARDALPSTPPEGDDPDALEAACERARALRAAFDDAARRIDAAHEALIEALADADARARERAAHLEAARAGWGEASGALATLGDQTRTLQERAEQAATPHGAAVDEALEQLRRLVEQRLRHQAPGAPTDDDLDAWVEAAQLAAVALDRAREVDVEGAAEAVTEAVAAAEQAAAERDATLQALEGERAAANEALAALLQRADAALAEAGVAAEDHPLEAALPLAALEQAREQLAAIELPTTLADDVEQARQQVQACSEQLQAAQAHDPAPLLEALREAIAAAEAAQSARRERVERAAERVRDAATHLISLQQAADERVASLPQPRGWPETESAWADLDDALVRLGSLTIDPRVDDDPERAEASAEAAEAVAATDVTLDACIDALRRAHTNAVEARAEARARIARSAEALQQLLASVRAARDVDGGLPDTEPVRAAARALERIEAELIDGQPDAPPDDADSATLVEHAAQLEASVQRAAARDIDGLRGELVDAVTAARAAELEAEADRLDTLDRARAAFADGLARLDAELRDADNAIAAADGLARGDDLQALAAAQRALVDARTLRGALATGSAELVDTMGADEAIARTMDAEGLVERALTQLQQATSAATRIRRDHEAVTAHRERSHALADDATALVDAVQQAAQAAPAPRGDEAGAFADQLGGLSLDAEALRVTVQLGLDALTPDAVTPDQAREVADQIAAATKELRGTLERTRAAVTALHQANTRADEQAQQAAREQAAEALERAALATKRADRALEDIARALDEARRRAAGHEEDAQVSAALTDIARANEATLELADQARAAAQLATKTDPPEKAAGQAVEAADRAGMHRDAAREAVRTITARVDALIAEAAEAREREQAAVLTRRDATAAKLRAQVDAVEQRLVRFRAPEPGVDDALAQAAERATQSVQDSLAQVAAARESLGLLEACKAGDVDHFLQETERALARLRSATDETRARLNDLSAAQEVAAARGAELAIEEARGRAWEACRLARSLSTDLVRAREALPPPPNPMPPRVREAFDRLAEIERRLWRAGQRADEARERAGLAEDLDAVRAAADAAEKAIGNRSRWEREFDTALGALTQLLRPEEGAATPPRDERMRNLRRGRLQASRADAPAEGPPPDNPTEALLARLRRNRNRGETGQERLQRLRREQEEERRARAEADAAKADRIVPLDPVSLPASEYPSLQEFEDYQATTVDQRVIQADDPADATIVDAPAVPGQRFADLAERRRQRRQQAEARRAGGKPGDDARTQAFPRARPTPPDEDEDDTKTQAFSREMLDAYLNSEDTAPAFADDDD